MKKLIFVDDDSIERKSIERLLLKLKEKCNLEFEIESYVSAVDVFTEVDFKEVNVLITDLLMPIMTGPELAKHVKSKHSNVIIIGRTNVVDPDSDYNCDYVLNKNDDQGIISLLCRLLST